MTTRDAAAWFSARMGPSSSARPWRVDSATKQRVDVRNEHGDRAVIAFIDENISDDHPVIRIFLPESAICGTCFAVVPYEIPAEGLDATITHALEYDRLHRADPDSLPTWRKDYLLRELIDIGKLLSTYKSIDDLLEVILEKSRHIIGADAGSIFVVDETETEPACLRFVTIQNDSIPCQVSQFTLPVNTTSIAGAAAAMKQSIAIPDVRRIPADAPYRFDPSFDERTGYRTISMLAVPMINQEGTVMGVIQLINKKRTPAIKLLSAQDFAREVIPMDDESVALATTLASQAGVALENARLYQEIQHIFSGFVRASVHAIEQRDPTTSGHSFRVAALTRELAKVVAAQTQGPFATVSFSDQDLREIEIAALLHDFGKVGVREEVLLKAKKLYPQNLEVIRARLDFIRTSIINDHLQRRLMMLEEGAPSEELAILDAAKERSIADIDECWRIINTANEPTVLEDNDFAKVEEVAARTFFDVNGTKRHYLEREELDALLVAKGSLTPEELEEIRSHAAHTISFLERIPWGRSLRRVPHYAGCHHEKLDGSGYPAGLRSEQIPLPSKIMAVADIYDALTAADRPYKKAVPLPKALEILDYEVADGHIDGDLVALFKQYEVYRVVDGTNPEDLITI